MKKLLLFSMFCMLSMMSYAESVTFSWEGASTDTGKSETITLNYDAEYVASDYASDIRYFTENLRPKKNRIQTFRNKGQVDFKKI